MKEEDKSKLVEVFTGSPWEAELVKSLLGNSDIEAVSVLVNEKDSEAAMEVVCEYEKKHNGD